MFDQSLDIERTFDHDVHMHRTYVRRRRTIAIVGTALVAVLLSPLGAGAVRRGEAPAPPARQAIVVVQPGDTLWDIAQRVRPGADPRDTVILIQEANGVDAGTLQVGQSLVVPA
jgi:Tfp pilus assembly protein FimV